MIDIEKKSRYLRGTMMGELSGSDLKRTNSTTFVGSDNLSGVS